MNPIFAWGRRHGFLLTLAVLFAIGFTAADVLRPVAEQEWLRGAVVFAVMWASGMTLPLRSVTDAVRRPMAVLAAVSLNTLAVPVAAWWIAGWMAPEWRLSFYVASLVPCTLASAMVWTRRAGGDDSIPMLTTVVTNLACVGVIPLGWWWVSETEAVVELTRGLQAVAGSAVTAEAAGAGGQTLGEQAIKLGLVVVAPLTLAQCMRLGGWAEWADRTKPRLSWAAQGGILTMVVFGAVTTADKLASITEEGGMAVFAQLIATASVIHLLCLLAGILLTRWVLGRGPETQIAVGFSASQKTLAIGLQTSMDLGVSVLPMIIYHVIQLVWDTVVADAWMARGKKDSSD
ncbi:transport facilitation [Rhodopirellula islandica]|uniref:Transport facilitation n=1 Tax=Rhodopirellula islandica TaxID=595434 RepID=A0A0J1BN50_RHOIS|nr:bile acid:sodium symporter [Rhodopirellula islandica]KLU07892.1 transport facilitation [Rhodopirellula islandica]